MEQNANAENSINAAAAGISISEDFQKVKSRVRFESEADADELLENDTTDTDPVASITINNTLSPDALKNALVQHHHVKFVTFNAGILAESSMFDFNSHIILPKLKKLTIRIPSREAISAQNPPIPAEFKRLFHFLKVVEYGELESLDIICSPDRGICLPLASAIIPCYDPQDSNPLMDLIRLNRNTMKSIAVGPALNKFYLKLNSTDCSSICEPRCIQQLEVFKGFPNFPMLLSWSKMLRPQKHLTKLYVAFNDPEVWKDVTEAIKLSSDSLTTFKFKAFGCQPATLDLDVLKDCSRLHYLGIRYLGVQLKGFESLPPCIKQITLAGQFTPEDTECMAKTLYMIEDIYLVIKPVYICEAEKSQSVNILEHPVFEFIKNASPSLNEFVVDSTDVALDFGPIKRWAEYQLNFKFIEHSDSEFSLKRDLSIKEVELSSPSQEVNSPEAEEVEESSTFFAPCMSTLGWQT